MTQQLAQTQRGRRSYIPPAVYVVPLRAPGILAASHERKYTAAGADWVDDGEEDLDFVPSGITTFDIPTTTTSSAPRANSTSLPVLILGTQAAGGTSSGGSRGHSASEGDYFYIIPPATPNALDELLDPESADGTAEP